MATCNCGHGCSSGSCPNGCICVYYHATDECFAECVDHKLPPKGKIKVTSETKVDFCAQEIKLSDIAMFLDSFLPDQIAIPAARAYTPISQELKETSLAEVVKSLGLVTL